MNLKFIVVAVLILIFGLLNIMVGSVNIPIGEIIDVIFGKSLNDINNVIILQSRVPQSLTAIFAGSALSVSGLLLQTVFRNPLAGPSILGVSTGASFGVALIILSFGHLWVNNSLSYNLLIIFGALFGAILVLGIILFISNFVKNNLMLLIIGVMISYISSSAISFLNFFSSADSVKTFAVWGMGNFSGVTSEQIPFFVISISFFLFLTFLLVKPLDVMLLGDNYARGVGLNIKLNRNLLLFATGILTAIVTAFCGPVTFIGLSVPHISRLILKTNSHKLLLPFTIMVGSLIALICNLLCICFPKYGVLPLNVVTPLFGAPIIIYIIFNQHKLHNFN
ncbi:MAG: iron ABC transporter permease [Bacteroidales bacterium]|nr:iron ABC transporter permease [Bacteroidales bacterium]